MRDFGRRLGEATLEIISFFVWLAFSVALTGAFGVPGMIAAIAAFVLGVLGWAAVWWIRGRGPV